ncbi:4'-phosphopantetheinyl transferase family protein [Kribbella sp. CA-293567]|uniref:4'-phosphopantetheinyl transferase family protein n=1 Tax=Kribbella sp. CA-293567 TaxID=3002436 RepID=UPI0022DE6563|nr:4'-phosphopantetheinyl transferase superfamily protein [Kribbella sp. CA-293567]WBQ06418.1 4'-phosphopantetheinyl transferase superfamily protein [Kribbella sp. CA-293567]
MNLRPGTDLAPVHVWLAPAHRDQRRVAHELLLDLAESLLGARPVLHHDDLGRPLLPPLWVSVSHTPDLVAVAAGQQGPVGVDVENQHAREVATMARRWFDPAELAWMADQPDGLQAFLHLWTAKEAVGKALGKGLRNSGLRRLMPLTGGLVASEPALTVQWPALRTGGVLAVAVPAGTPSLEIVEHHGAALRRTVVSRTSFPVVVRGN